MIYTVTLNPALDKTVEISNFCADTVNRISKMRSDPGGKGINVSKVIKKLGGESVAVGILAGSTGRTVLAALEAEGIVCDFVFTGAETRTNLKIIDPVNHTNTDINEQGPFFCADTAEKVLSRLTQKAVPGDIVVLAGSLPKGAPANTYRTWITRLHAAGAKVFLDADGELLAEGIKAAPYLIKPNNDELSRIAGQELTTETELVASGKDLIGGGVKRAVVTLGGDGALYIDGNEVYRADGLPVTIGSTVGAGDSVVAALAVSEQHGLSIDETIRLSTATGAANVMCSGTQAAEYSVIEELMPKVTYRKL